jgi:uncharacterized protein (TIGR00369 family)
MRLSAFEHFVHLQVDENTQEKTVVSFPAQAVTLNLGGTLHGGASMSIINMAARHALCPFLDDVADTIRTLDQSVRFTSTARGEKIIARAVVLKKGKELAFVEVDVANDEGKQVSKGLVTLRFGASPAEAEEVAEVNAQGNTSPRLDVRSYYPEEWQPGPMAQWLAQRGFTANLGLRIAHAHAGLSVVRLEPQAHLLNAHGRIDDGAIATLCDSAGAMAAISMNNDSMARGSTPSLHINYYDTPKHETLVALGSGRWRQQESFLATVQVAGENSGTVYADAQVLFRIV